MTVKLETEILSLMKKANESYNEYAGEVSLMFSNISDVYQLTESLEGTEFIISQWDVLLVEAENTLLIVKYFKLWEKNGTLPEKTIAIGVGNVKLAIQNIIVSERQLIVGG